MDFIGNEKVVNLLKSSLIKERINHAYIFSGPEHVGKFALAKKWSQSVVLGRDLGFDVDESSKDAVLDLVVVSPEVTVKNGVSKQRDIPIETIRDAQQKLSLFPYCGKYKILIIDDAHRLNNSSQNALLKILEEPNPTTIIILVTSEIDRILPTIISRCQEIKFGLVDDLSMKKGSFTAEITQLSMGRPGLAKLLADDNEELLMRREAVSQLNVAISGSLNEKFALAEELSKDIAKTNEKLNVWIWNLYAKIKTVDSFEQAKIYAAIEKIQNCINTTKRTNANSRLILETLFMDL